MKRSLAVIIAGNVLIAIGTLLLALEIIIFLVSFGVCLLATDLAVCLITIPASFLIVTTVGALIPFIPAPTVIPVLILALGLALKWGINVSRPRETLRSPAFRVVKVAMIVTLLALIGAIIAGIAVM